MRAFFQKHRTICISFLGILVAVIFCFYLRTLGEHGVWYRDFFMAQQADGTLIGRDEWYNSYRLTKEASEAASEITFSVNGETRVYRVHHGDSVEIFENDVLKFSGEAHPMGDSWLLLDEKGESEFPLTVIAGGVQPTQDELFPNLSTVYCWAKIGEYGTRGDFSVLFFIAMLLVFLFVDLRFPNFFWNLKHALAVDGGEPSEFYRVGQAVGRIIVVIAIGMIMLASLKFG